MGAIAAVAMLVMMVVALVLIGVGIAVGVALCAAMALFVALGVVSASVVLGVLTGRKAVAVRAFLMQSGALLGLAAGAGFAVLVDQLALGGATNPWVMALYGAPGGAFAGVILALVLERLWRWVESWVTARSGPPMGRKRRA